MFITNWNNSNGSNKEAHNNQETLDNREINGSEDYHKNLDNYHDNDSKFNDSTRGCGGKKDDNNYHNYPNAD